MACSAPCFSQRADTSTYISYYFNAGKMVTNGLEVILQMNSLMDLQAQLAGTWQETDDERLGFADITVEYSPNFLGYLQLAYRLENKTFSLTGNYVGEMETHWEIEKVNPDSSLGGRVGDKVEDHVTLAVNLRVDNLFDRKYYLNLKVTNLLDEEYLYPMANNNSPWAASCKASSFVLYLLPSTPRP